MRLIYEQSRYVVILDRNAKGEEIIAHRAGLTWDNSARAWLTTSAIVASRLIQYATPSLYDRLAPLVRAAQESAAADAALDIPSPTGWAYLPFQRAGIAGLIRRKRALLADEMGLGKTVQVLGLINADPTIKRVLVVCPASLKLNWLREARRWLVRHFDLRVLMSGDDVSHIQDGDFLIVNYDILERFPALELARLDLMVCDECHYLKNANTKRSKAVDGITAARLVFLTGTPIPNRVFEIWPVASRLAGWPEEAKRRFVARYCRYDAMKDLRGPQRNLRDLHLAELQDNLRKTIMIRRLKSEVLTELPPKFRQVIELDPGSARAIVRNEVETYDAWQLKIETAKADAAKAKVRNESEYKAAVSALQDTVHAALIDIGRLRHVTALAKVPHVIERLKDLLGEQAKVVCFAHHKDVIAQIAAAFPGCAVVLTGDTPQAERQWNVDQFQANPGIRLFVGSIIASGLGITLTAASTAVFAELDWTPGNVTQSEDRLHRIGAKDSVLIIHLLFDESLDARMVKELIRKQELADRALDTKAG